MLKGIESNEICSICKEEDDETYEIRNWIQCDLCYQWVHCDCAEVGESVVEDEFAPDYVCDKCNAK